MKQNLEDIIKEQLEHYEAPYDSAAWKEMNDKLDTRSSKGQKPSSSGNFIKLTATVAAVLVAALFIYNYINTEKVKKADTNDLESLELQKEHEKVAPSSKQTESVVKSEKVTENSTENTEVNTAENTEGETSTQLSEVEKSKGTSTEKEIPENTEGTDDPLEPSNAQPNENTTDGEDQKQTIRRKFIPGIVSTSKLCEGQSLIVKNDGESDEYVRVRYDYTDLTIPAGQQSQLTLNETTEIQFLNDKGEIISATDVAVYKNPQVDFSIEANIFDEGLPIVNLKAYGSYKTYNWKVDNKTFEDKSVQTHLFNKGTYDATLTVVDHNNCKTDKTRPISIESDYNLMAVSGFKPEGNDHRNRTFMPYALTQRDVEFTMVIIDSRDHGIIYKTQDANEPWDGIDQRTGKMTPADRAYIWKVQLDTPLKGEKNVYVGTIVHD